MKTEMPAWWKSLRSWRALGPCLPLATMPRNRVTGIVVHRQGQYGLNSGNWVTGEPDGESNHFGWDVIGWVGGSSLHFLDDRIVCCSPMDGLVAWVGADEHGQPSMNLRHSPRNAERRRFSFFGDLDDVYVKAGQRIRTGTPLGRPGVFKQRCRFFHFGMGYEVRRNGKWHDVFINPGPAINAKIAVRPRLPW